MIQGIREYFTESDGSPNDFGTKIELNCILNFKQYIDGRMAQTDNPVLIEELKDAMAFCMELEESCMEHFKIQSKPKE
jgi:hypothetical protein